MGGDQRPHLPTAEETKPSSMRCAIYTRKSTEEGLNLEFNTLEAQREAAEAYVRSQLHAGWTALAERYDDGGFTGANLDRPALRRLLADIQAGKVDCVLVYKVDRLSRSLLDFARLMEILERHKVSLVSVTQPLNTTGSLGRLIMNILLSFAEFERGLISDRTKDKMAAARKKGKWVGGTPVLGYDISTTGGKLVVNPEEADRVRAIFALYLEHRSLQTTLREIRAGAWTTKRWTTREGKQHPGRPFTKGTLDRLLRNVLYLGLVSHQGQGFTGEQEAIVDRDVWERASQSLLKEQSESRSSLVTKTAAARRSASRTHRKPTERVPRITRLLAMALKFDELIRSGAMNNYTALAQAGGVSRSRITQMFALLNLAPDIQEEILFLRPDEAQELRISEPSVRRLTATLLWSQQREQWRKVVPPFRTERDTR